LLGILKAGGAYLPLDPTDPAERRAALVAAARPHLVLTGAVDDCTLDDADLVTGVATDNLAYVIYTSGSTGAPKGVAIDHCAIVNRLAWMQREYRLGDSDRVLQKTPVTFDVSVWELFWPLMAGATLVVAEPGGHRDGRYLVETVRRHAITTVHFVPSMLGAFVRTRTVEECRSLRHVFSSGEELPAQLARELADRLDVPLYNLYGPTEAAIDVTAWTCDPAETRVAIGRPIANTQIYVLDPHGQFVPIGVRGELFIGGIQVARGYLGRPDLTAERFVPDAFGDTPGRRLYRSGDAGSADATGTLRFGGRLDRQFKWHGIRLEPSELELVLERHPAVTQAIVDIVEDRLVAFVAGEAPADELKRLLRAHVSDALVPGTIVVLPHIPLLSSGKVDRTALFDALRLFDEDGKAPADVALPRTELQQEMLDIWRVLLSRRQIGVDDNFFDMGGHSMLAVQFVNAMYTQHSIDISVGLLFAFPTVSTLAEAVETTLWAADHRRSTPAVDYVEHEI
jgi:amino acid adenylation domain-containing protein